MTKKWLSKEEWFKQQRELRKKNICAFNTYNDVTDEMVNAFWNKPSYVDRLIPEDDIRNAFQNVYNIAKKNVAMLDYAMSSNYSVYFDIHGNLYILVNTGASWSSQNHLHHYADKCRNHFTIRTAAWSSEINDTDKWEPLYNPIK